MNNNGQKPNGIGLAAGIFGALAAVGGIAAAAASSKPKTGLRGSRPIRLKKPCGCGR